MLILGATVILGLIALAVSYRERRAILEPQPTLPSSALLVVLFLDLASVLPLIVLRFVGGPQILQALLPPLIFIGYIIVGIVVFVVKLTCKRSPLFQFSVLAPLLGCVLLLLMVISTRKEIRP